MAWKREEAADVIGIWDMTAVATVEELMKLWRGRSVHL